MYPHPYNQPPQKPIASRAVQFGLIAAGFLILFIAWSYFRFMTRYVDEIMKPDSPTPVASSLPQGIWHTAKHWEGTGTKTTESFNTKGSEFRVLWSRRSIQGIPLSFDIHVYSSDDDGLKEYAYDTHQTETSKDETTVHSGPGTYYIKIDSQDDWIVEVRDFY